MGERTGKVLIVGIGGLGCPAALALALDGTLEVLGLADDDLVEPSNLPRQVLHRDEDVGQPKARSAAAKLSAVSGAPAIRIHEERVDSRNAAALLGRYDFVIDAADGAETKFLLNDVACRLGLPLAHAGVVGLEGQATTILPGETGCLRCLFPEVPLDGEVAACREAGILAPIAGLVGAIQANEALRWLRGERPALAGRLLRIDYRTFRFREVPFRRAKGCPTCDAPGSTPTRSAEPNGLKMESG